MVKEKTIVESNKDGSTQKLSNLSNICTPTFIKYNVTLFILVLCTTKFLRRTKKVRRFYYTVKKNKKGKKKKKERERERKEREQTKIKQSYKKLNYLYGNKIYTILYTSATRARSRDKSK